MDNFNASIANATIAPTPAATFTRQSNLVTHLNYFLASLYSVLLLITAIILYIKIRRFKKLKLGLIYVCYITAMCIIRFIYMVMPRKGWRKVILHSHGASYMNFIDLLPELIFVSIFLLTTIMWGTAWTRARKVKVFKERSVVRIHTGIVLLIFWVAIFLSAAIRTNNIKYAEVVLWEAYYVITVSGVAVIASIILGVLLYRTFKDNHTQNASPRTTRHMNHLLALLVLTTVSFILKGTWNLVIGKVARTKWVNYEMSSSKFGTLWFFYYFLTELLPLSLALVQQWRSEVENSDTSSESKATGATNAYSHSSGSKRSYKESKRETELKESGSLALDSSTSTLTVSTATSLKESEEFSPV